jgi:sodium-dependent dicarboxylate transporter 2/3/5
MTAAEPDAIEGERAPSLARAGVAVLVGIALYFAGSALTFPSGVDPVPGKLALGVTGFVATCWVTGALPLAAASLVPFAFFPMLGIMPTEKVAPAYSDPVLYLFFGGFALALGMQRWGLHRRLALRVIVLVGTAPRRLVLGFMSATAVVSMFTNNTATTLMFFPIAVAVVESMRGAGCLPAAESRNFGIALMLGIAFASSIGGIATPIGTAPNMLFFSNFHDPYVKHNGAPAPTFLTWVACFLPLTIVMIPAMWILFVRVLCPVGRGTTGTGDAIRAEARALPPMGVAERRMLWLFLTAVLLWMTREDIDLGNLGRVPGWWRLLQVFGVPDSKYLGEGSVGVLVAILAFAIPVDARKGVFLLDWDSAKKMPWEVLILLGGGIAIARSFESTKLSGALANLLQPLIGNVSPFVLVLAICALMTFLTEFTSNTALAALMLPVLKSAAEAAQVDPRLLMLPATAAASLGFMMPAGTPPNAVVFGTGLVPLRRMVAIGFWMDLLGIALLTLLVWFVVIPVLGIDPKVCPEWARLPR